MHDSIFKGNIAAFYLCYFDLRIHRKLRKLCCTSGQVRYASCVHGFVAQCRKILLASYTDVFLKFVANAQNEALTWDCSSTWICRHKIKECFKHPSIFDDEDTVGFKESVKFLLPVISSLDLVWSCPGWENTGCTSSHSLIWLSRAGWRWHL